MTFGGRKWLKRCSIREMWTFPGVATAEGSSVKSAETQTTSHSPLLKSQGMAQSSGPRQLLQLKISGSRMGKS